MAYTVFIPAAGTGSRLGGLTKYISKALVSIENVPTLTRIMDMFPEDTKFVVAVGYKGDIVKEYIELACNKENITVVDIDPYEGEGSGLGYTIRCCKEHLETPFIFCSCDTLVLGEIPAPEYNWMGVDIRDDKSQYRTVSCTEDGRVISINEKGKDPQGNGMPYIGLAGIHDYELFWKAMDETDDSIVLQGESYGLRRILQDSRIKEEKFTWFDTGVTVELATTRQRFRVEGSPNILEKANEAIWILKDKVIKFSADPDFIADRVERSRYLNGFVPQITGYTKHMYSYNYIPGKVLSKCISLPLFKQFLNTANVFWKKEELTAEEEKLFQIDCMKFYREKTYERVAMFFQVTQKKDEPTLINHIWYSSLDGLLKQVDWDYVSKGIAGQFHGDFHFENILYDEANDKFEFLDWRQNFGNSRKIGDIYYDLAKLLHGMIISHEIVVKDAFYIQWEEQEIHYDFNRKQMLILCENYYYKWLEKNGYDVNKVRMITALIFLNIAALHHYPYSLVLMSLGKEMLSQALEGNT